MDSGEAKQWHVLEKASPKLALGVVQNWLVKRSFVMFLRVIVKQ